MLIRSITQNAMDNKFSIRQFPSPGHPYIAFPQKNLAVLDISRFTFCKVDYMRMIRSGLFRRSTLSDRILFVIGTRCMVCFFLCEEGVRSSVHCVFRGVSGNPMPAV